MLENKNLLVKMIFFYFLFQKGIYLKTILQLYDKIYIQ